MKILTEQYIKDRGGKIAEARIREDETSNDVTPIKLTLSWVLARICNSYVPSPELTLQIKEIRSLNKILDIVDADKNIQIDDKLEFEDEDFSVLKKVVLHIVPTVVFIPILMAAPQIEDIFNQVE